jgi:protein phosphatase
VAWRITQSQYYVGTAAGQVVIFRGINESVAGLSLSSDYRHTGIPVAHVQSSVLSLPTTAGTLAEAEHTVLNIRHSYDCKIALAAVTSWTVHKPPPPPVIAKGHKPTPAQTRAINAAKNYPAKPAVPSFCPAQGAG